MRGADPRDQSGQVGADVHGHEQLFEEFKARDTGHRELKKRSRCPDFATVN